jgi:hypothetical protein
MDELIGRLEKATAPDRELDDAIRAWLSARRIGIAYMPYPNYTSSIDAALTLVPAGCQWTIEQDAAWVRWLTEDDVGEAQGVLNQREGECTAICICIAALKARAALTPTE